MIPDQSAWVVIMALLALFASIGLTSLIWATFFLVCNKLRKYASK